VTRVVLVWLEAVEPGTAPAYHLTGTRRRLAAAGIDDVRVIASTDRSRWRRWISVFARASAASLRRGVVVARWHPLILPLAIIWRMGRRRIVYLVQGTFDDAFAAHQRFHALHVGRVLLKWSMRLGDAWIAPHAGIAEWLDGTVGSGRTLVIPNGYPIVEPGGSESADGLGLPERFVLFAGSLATWQGIGVMLAASDSSAWPSDVHLLVIGDGPERWRLEGRGERVVHLGRQPPAAVRHALARSIASLSPKLLDDVTRRGISPFKLLEAGLEGVPVVATEVPGQSEYVRRYGCGLLVEPGDADGLAGAVARLSADKALRDSMGRAAQLAVSDFAWENGAPDLLAAITGGSSGRPSGHESGSVDHPRTDGDPGGLVDEDE
jgi:glycosyltransferase involved in cell wall biosynthesis